MSANKYCPDPDSCTYYDCPTAFCDRNAQHSLAAMPGSASDRERLKAKMAGACAALEGRKLDANQYPEESDLHFEWLDAWTSAKIEMRKTPNGPS